LKTFLKGFCFSEYTALPVFPFLFIFSFIFYISFIFPFLFSQKRGKKESSPLFIFLQREKGGIRNKKKEKKKEGLRE